MPESKVFSIRVHPSNPYEAKFIEIMDVLKEEGYSNREIIVDAVLYADGKTPEMFSGERLTEAIVERMLSEFAQSIVSELEERGIAVGQMFGTPNDSGDDFTDVEHNLVKSVMARRKARGRGG